MSSTAPKYLLDLLRCLTCCTVTGENLRFSNILCDYQSLEEADVWTACILELEKQQQQQNSLVKHVRQHDTFECRGYVNDILQSKRMIDAGSHQNLPRKLHGRNASVI